MTSFYNSENQSIPDEKLQALTKPPNEVSGVSQALTDYGSLACLLKEIEDPGVLASLLRRSSVLKAARTTSSRGRACRALLEALVPGIAPGSLLRLDDDIIVIMDAAKYTDVYLRTVNDKSYSLWELGDRSATSRLEAETAEFLGKRKIASLIKEASVAIRRKLKENPALKEALEEKKQVEQTVLLVEILGPIIACRDALNLVEGAVRKGTVTKQTIDDLNIQLSSLNRKKSLIRKALAGLKAK